MAHVTDFRRELYDTYVTGFKDPGALGADENSRTWSAWRDFKYLPLLSKLDKNGAILDVGCGTGLMLEYLQRRGFRNIVGIDISLEQVERAVQRGVKAERTDAWTYLARSHAEFDAIFAIDIVEHFAKSELMPFFRLMKEALKPGGMLIVQTPNGQGLLPNEVIYGDFTHLTMFTPSSLAQLLRASGFDDLAFYETGPAPINVRSRIRLVLWRCIKLVAKSVRMIETGKSQEIWTETFICNCHRPLDDGIKGERMEC